MTKDPWFWRFLGAAFLVLAVGAVSGNVGKNIQPVVDQICRLDFEPIVSLCKDGPEEK